MTPSKGLKKSSHILTRWAMHLKESQEKARFNQRVVQTLQDPVLQRLLSLLKEDLASLDRSDPDYHNPAWAYELAHVAGRRQTLRDLINLLQTRDHINDPIRP